MGDIVNFYEPVKKELPLVEKEIEKLIPKEPKEVYGMLLPFIQRGGKRIRPILLLLCCGATGGDKLKAIRHAALIEIFHSFTLIHDDICDNSLVRRGHPTINVEYGVPIAVNSGDALYTLLWKWLSWTEMPYDKSVEIMRLCADAFLKVVEGQGIELGWYKKERFNIEEDEYFRMVEGKTATLMELSCELGAIISDSPEDIRKALKSFGKNLGLAFQIRDDILNLVGKFDEYKKEIGGDITEGKRTLMVAYTLKTATKKDSAELIKILSKKTKKKTEINRAIDILKKYGSIEYANKKADELTEAAKKMLDVLEDSPEKRALLELADFVTRRTK
jgi:geranylgeranyl diphosphate synthase type I